MSICGSNFPCRGTATAKSLSWECRNVELRGWGERLWTQVSGNYSHNPMGRWAPFCSWHVNRLQKLKREIVTHSRPKA